MKRLKLYLSSLLMLVAAPFFLAACSSEEMGGREPEGTHTCRLVWDGEIGSYGNGTRAVRRNQDGDCVLLRFKSGSDYVNGKAVYSLATDEWTLTYEGSLTYGSCQAYFFEGETSDGSIALHQGMVVRGDEKAQYAKEGDVVKLSAKVYPTAGRIRFKGEAGRTFLFSGVKYYTGFNTGTFELTTAQAPLELTVGTDGYTPYVHALPLADSTLTIYYDYQTYKIPCESPILDAGRSGFMMLPTEDAHNGWELAKVELPTLSAVTTSSVSDVMAELKATVSSLGNGTIMDAGFVVAETENPTVEASTKISCGAVTGLSAVLTDLKPETQYYVRAYATNEIGLAYGPQLAFRTTATPTVPTVRTVKVIDIKVDRAEVMANISDMGATVEISQRGFVWSTNPMPTLEDQKTTLGATAKLGDFTGMITGLLPHTVYYVRAYATNTVGTGYGEVLSFTTLFGNAALTSEVKSVRYDGASVQTTITELGGHVVSERGICWATTDTPTLDNNVVVSTSTDNTFTSTIDGLAEATAYYVRSYIKIEEGEVVYSEIHKFTTPFKDDQFERDEYEEEDEDWTNGIESEGTEVGKDGFEDDEDWANGTESAGSEVGKDGFEADEDWANGAESAASEISKDGFGEDEEWSASYQ